MFHSEINLKQGAQRNKGIEESKGEYILFLDADDWLCENALANLLECAIRTKADVVIGDYIEYDQKTDATRRDYTYDTNEVRVSKEDYLNKCLFSCRKLFRASFIKENGVRFAEGIFFEDTFFRYISSWYVESAVYVRKPIIYYRRHDTNTTAKTTAPNEYYKFCASALILEEARKRGFCGEYMDGVVEKYNQDALSILLEMYLGFEEIETEYIKLMREQIHKEELSISGNIKTKLIYKTMLCCPRVFMVACKAYRKV